MSEQDELLEAHPNSEELEVQVMNALETVIDPELGIDIVNLGLVYGVHVDINNHCTVKMTLTTMGCPLADIIADEVHRAIQLVDDVDTVEIDLVWYPAWSTERMSRYARIALGIR